jgi:ankyrin repeat protein
MARDFTAEDHRAFHDAIRSGNADRVQMMLAEGMSPEADVHCVSPLFAAAADGTPEIIDLLVRAGAKPNRRIPSDDSSLIMLCTALNGAAALGRLECIERLLDHGAEPRSVSDSQSTAAHILVESIDDSADEEFVAHVCRILVRMLDLGLPINQRGENHKTLLHLTVEQCLPGYVLEMLLARGADPHILDKHGESPLHESCLEYRLEQLQTLLQHGVDVNARDAAGKTPLHLCFYHPGLAALLSLTPDLEIRDNLGRTPLGDTLHAWQPQKAHAWAGKEKALQLLVAGASADTPDFEGITPRDIARSKGLTDILSYMDAQDARAAMYRAAGAARTLRPAA